MDKADLLAAGRKKLQQYRQKKGNSSKGSSSGKGKTSNKSAKSDVDIDAASGSSKPSGLPEVLEGETPYVKSDIPLNDTEGGVNSSLNASNDEVLGNSVANAELEVKGNPEDSVIIHDDSKNHIQVHRNDSNLEGEIGNSACGGNLAAPRISANVSSDDANEAHQSLKTDVRQPRQIRNHEKGTLEANDMDPTKTGGITDNEAHGDRNFNFSDSLEPRVDKQDITSGMTENLEEPSWVDGGVMSGDGAGISRLSDSVVSFTDTVIESDENSLVSQKRQGGENILSDYSLMSAPIDQQFNAEGSFILIEKTPEKFISQGDVVLSDSLLSVSSKDLHEYPLRLQLNCREANLAPDLDSEFLISKMHYDSSFWDLLNEERFLKNCENDIVYLVLSKQSEAMRQYNMHVGRMNDELAELRCLLEESQAKNSQLIENLSNSARHVAESAKDDLKSELEVLKAKMADLHDVQERLETSLSDNVSLSDKLAESQMLVVALESEKMILNERILSVSGENLKMIEEIDNLLYENKSHQNEVAHLKTLVSALQDQCAKTSDLVNVATDEREKIEKEKLFLAGEYEKVSTERSSFKDLVETLHIEIANLRDGIISSEEVRKNIEQQRDMLTEENNKLSLELQSLGEQFSINREQNSGIQDELEVMSSRIEHLTAENAILRRENECHHLADANLSKVKVELDAVLEDMENLSASNTEFRVINEVYKSYIRLLTNWKDDLLSLYEASRLNNISLGEERDDLQKRQNQSDLVTIKLQEELLELRQSSNVVVTALKVQLEHVQNEVAAKALVMKLAQDTSASCIIDSCHKLHELVGHNPNIGEDTDVTCQLPTYVDTTLRLIHKLTEEVKIASEKEEISAKNLEETKEKCNELLSESDLSYKTMKSLLSELRSLLSNSDDTLVTKVEPGDHHRLNEELLKKFIVDKLPLPSVSRDVRAEFVSGMRDVNHLDNLIFMIVQCIENSFNDKMDELNRTVYCFALLVLFSVCCYGNVKEQLRAYTINSNENEAELPELHGREIDTVLPNERQDDEVSHLRQRLTQVEEALKFAESQLQEKENELEISEQKVVSIRDKLGIAVAKGKGLVGQRDALKQSLAETSSELERCLHEIQLKDSRIHEVEEMLKTYIEAGERVEALESELSYIRNSATALRESFLLKDSVLLRIEEILEDLNLSDDFHSSDIIEKVSFLAGLVKEQSLPHVVGGLDNAKDSGECVEQPVMDSADDMKRKFDELHAKFYEMAEQNEMLEQSLMERNLLVQRWETVFDGFDVPPQIRSLDPEGRIEWINDALSRAFMEQDKFMQKNDELERCCASLSTEMDELRDTMSCLTAELERCQKRNIDLTSSSENLVSMLQKLSSIIVYYVIEAKILQDQETILEEELQKYVGIRENLNNVDEKIKRLIDYTCNNLLKSELVVPVGLTSIDCLETLVMKLMSDHQNIDSNQIVSELQLAERNVAKDRDDEGVVVMKEGMDDVLARLKNATDERDRYMILQQALTRETEDLKKRLVELQELVSLEEQKSNSSREKLNVAVRKGKLLVQQRDGLKQEIEDMNNKVKQLESEIKHREEMLFENEMKIKALTVSTEKVTSLESEISLLKAHLFESENALNEKANILTTVLNTLRDLDIGCELTVFDPLEKLETIAKLCRNYNQEVAALQQESKKSRRSAELLLAELNEVQDQNDHLQEQLMKATESLAELSKEREHVVASKDEALSNLEKVSRSHHDEKTRFLSEFESVKSAIIQLKTDFLDINDLLSAFSKDLEYMQHLEGSLEPWLTKSDGDENKKHPSVLSSDSKRSYDNLAINVKDSVNELLTDIASLKPRIRNYLAAWYQQTEKISKSLDVVRREVISKNSTCESLKEDLQKTKLDYEAKEREVALLRKNVSVLYLACANSIVDLESGRSKNNLDGNDSFLADISKYSYAIRSGKEGVALSEDHTVLAVDRLSRNLSFLKDELAGNNINEMKSTVENLRKEIREKDSERERVYAELVKQIKEAEEFSRLCSVDLQSSQARVLDLENQLQQKVQEFEDAKIVHAELQDKMRSKDQEIEALMEALDEEEVQLEDLKSKMEELEDSLKQKTAEILNLEASREKIAKKLSVTVNKFDELHGFSEGILAEVENLQSQVKDRDAEISFLRQEVTRCTNDVLAASQMSEKRISEEFQEFLKWVDAMLARDGVQAELDDGDAALPWKELIQKRIASVFSALQSKNTQLQSEMRRAEDLARSRDTLQKALNEKEESRLSAADSAERSSSPSEIMETEALTSKRKSKAPTSSQVRSLRKGNGDPVAIAIDVHEDAGDRARDEDDEKVHGFKSLTTSRFVPKFTRPVSDMIDGFWVSCDRALMRQPGLRVGIMMYWALMHALLAAFVF